MRLLAAGLLACGLSLPVAALPGSPWLLVVCGVGGDAAHRETFDARAQTLIDATTAGALDPEHVIYLAERPDEVERASGVADAGGVTDSIRRIAAATEAGDFVMIVLIGHGSGRQDGGRFNLRGPDMGPNDFAALLGLLEDRRIAFVNTTSSSGGFLQLAGSGRAIVTATANTREREEPRFGQYFVDAYEGARADLDKDGEVSLAEAFEYAALEVGRFYEDEGRLQTEHSRLLDIADAEPAAAPLEEGDVGRLARRMTFGAGGGLGAPGDDPERQALLAARGRGCGRSSTTSASAGQRCPKTTISMSWRLCSCALPKSTPSSGKGRRRNEDGGGRDRRAHALGRLCRRCGCRSVR